MEKLSFLLEEALNWVLRLDPDYRRWIEPLVGSVLCVEAKPFPPLYFSIRHSRLHVAQGGGDWGDWVDCGVSGPVHCLRVLGQKKGGIGVPEGVVLSGNMEILQEWNALYRRFEIDWEGILARFLGDTVAYGAMSGLGGVKQAMLNLFHIGGMNTRDYLQEETHCLPTVYEAAVFMDEVDRLRGDVARLMARVDRLGLCLSPMQEKSC